MAKSNKTRYAVLGMLSLQPSSGYEIKKMMEQSTDHFWREGDSSIYPILKQLLEEGMVTCEIGNAESDKPKKIYAITPEGQSELQDWLIEEPMLYPNRNELLLKVFFGWNVEPQIMINHLENFRRHVKKLLDKYQAAAKNECAGFFYPTLTLRSGILHAEASLTWCDETLAILKKA